MTTVGLLDISTLLNRTLSVRGANSTSKVTRSDTSKSASALLTSTAALDATDLTSKNVSGSGKFTFNLTKNEDGTSTLTIELDGSAITGTDGEEGTTSNFSLSLQIGADGEVTLPDGIDASSNQIEGQDFSYSKSGVLQLDSSLAAKVGADTGSVDLSGSLDDEAQDTLKRLGLIDESGKATKLLQFLSDYAGLNRFKEGQKVSTSTDESYGISQDQINAVKHAQLLQQIAAMKAEASASAQKKDASATSDEATTSVTASASKPGRPSGPPPGGPPPGGPPPGGAPPGGAPPAGASKTSGTGDDSSTSDDTDDTDTLYEDLTPSISDLYKQQEEDLLDLIRNLSNTLQAALQDQKDTTNTTTTTTAATTMADTTAVVTGK